MAITLSDDARKQALASIRRYCAENLRLELEPGDLKIASQNCNRLTPGHVRYRGNIPRAHPTG